MDMRYVGQWRSLTVPVSTPLEENLDASLERFHNEHEREYAFSDPDQAVEIYGLRVVGLGLVDKPEFPKVETAPGAPARRSSAPSTSVKPAASSTPRSTTARRCRRG